MAQDALIGTGLVGTLLQNQRPFDAVFNSRNIESIRNRSFRTVYCAAMPGTKWLANQKPDADWAALQKLAYCLVTIEVEQFVLVSTVDVFSRPLGVTESSLPVPAHAYGRHRHLLETFVRCRFQSSLVVRLPGIIAKHATKGPLFDVKHNHQVERLCRRSEYQWYPGRHLLDDCEHFLAQKTRLVHLTTPPIGMAKLAPRLANQMQSDNVVCYDVQTMHNGPYHRERPWDDLREYFT